MKKGYTTCPELKEAENEVIGYLYMLVVLVSGIILMSLYHLGVWVFG